MRLEGKVAVVTGASRGIGRAIALGYAREGAGLLLVARSDSDLAEAAREAQAVGARAEIAVADVRDEAQVEAAVEAAVAAFGQVDILVNAAGIPMVAPSTELPLKDWRRCIETNLTGTFLSARAAARRMIVSGRGGRIINIGSLQSFDGFPMRVAYGASKGGVVQLTKALAVEWAPQGVHVNCIAPGFIHTAITDRLIAQGVLDIEPIVRRTPARRMGHVEDVVGPAIFLATAEADFVVGATLLVDGGYSANGWYE